MDEDPTATCHVCRRENVAVRDGTLAHHLIPGTEGREDGLSCRGSGEDPRDSYPLTVHLGVLTATRPLGARLVVVDASGDEFEGTLVNLTPSSRSTAYYTLHLRLENQDNSAVPLTLPLNHPVTLLTDRHGRPEDGHTFRITVVSRGSSGIMGPGDEKPHDYQDSPEFGDLELHAEVRAWSQSEALKRASEMELRDWRLPSGVSLWHARDDDLR